MDSEHMGSKESLSSPKDASKKEKRGQASMGIVRTERSHAMADHCKRIQGRTPSIWGLRRACPCPRKQARSPCRWRWKGLVLARGSKQGIPREWNPKGLVLVRGSKQQSHLCPSRQTGDFVRTERSHLGARPQPGKQAGLILARGNRKNFVRTE